MKLVTSKIVLIGNFNPYIVTPEWLRRQKIWPANERSIEFGGGSLATTRFRDDETEWLVTTERLEIVANPSHCGTLAAKVLEQLPHTPVSASLSSFSFGIDQEQMVAVDPIFEAIQTRTQSQNDVSLPRWGVVLQQDSVRTDVMFVRGESGTTASVNRRRPCRDAAIAGEAAAEMDADFAASRREVASILSLPL